MTEIWSNIVGVVGAVFLFGFAVFVHELGHFIVAKLVGVAVPKFALGFGPKLWSVNRGGTEYSLRAFPLGGFVALGGAPTDPQPASEESSGKKSDEERMLTEDLHALRSKPAWARIAVFSAGVTFNFLTAIVLVAFILWYGMPIAKPLPNVIEKVPEDSRMYRLGWRSGDRIVSVKQGVLTTDTLQMDIRQPLPNWNSVYTAMDDLFPNKEVSNSQIVEFVKKKIFKVKPNAEDSVTTWTFTVLRNADMENAKAVRLLLPPELDPNFMSPTPAYVGEIFPGSPAHRARMVKDHYTPGAKVIPMPTWEQMPRCPLQNGDTILAVNDEPVATWSELTKKLRARPNEPIYLTVSRPGDTVLLATMLETDPMKPEDGRLGIIGGIPMTGERERMPLGKALKECVPNTFLFADRIVFMTIKFMVEQPWKEVKRNLGGPMVIGIMAYKTAKRGLVDYVNLFISISIVLAFMNILPIPVLDGGYIMITIVEAIIRRPVPDRVLKPILVGFTTMFFMLFVFFFYNDFMNWVYRP
jgi:regulator of sigma E protease